MVDSYRFTSKELDSETGLYYYGARYQDPKTSRWLSTDPALSDYIPGAPINDEVRKQNGNLPGMGGVFNTVNLHLYHYAGNNPVKYTDPDGKKLVIIINKSSGTLDYVYTKSGSSQQWAPKDQIPVITNVQAGTPDNSRASDTTRTQGNGSNPTQVANGQYKITEARAPSTGEGKFGEGDQGLYIGVTQTLPNAKANDGTTVQDSGYMIHITPADYTDGCVGLPYDQNNPESKAAAEAEMNKLVDIFKDTMSEKGDKEAYIIFQD